MRIVLILAVLFALPFTTAASVVDNGHPQDTSGSASQQQKLVKTAATHVTDFGSPGNAKDIARTIDVGLLDTMRIVPDRMSIQLGQTVRLRVRNSGTAPHEFVLGTPKEILEHRDMMRTMPTMQSDEANAVSVAPGATAEIIWRFSKPGTFLYACLIPGHWESGMQGIVTVTAKSKS
jgi:uncharacterized cupredoxin-like copper-binding protein